MKRYFTLSAWALAGLGGLGVAGSGCYCGKCCLNNHDQVGVPAPPGTYVHKFQELQDGKAEATDFVFFLDEWYMGGEQLGPYGKYHVTQVVKRLPTVPFPVVIQPTADPARDEARRVVLVQALTQAGVPDAESRVIIAYPEAEGLPGEQGERAYYDMIFNRYLSNRYYGYGMRGGGGIYGPGFFGRNNLLGGFGGGNIGPVGGFGY